MRTHRSLSIAVLSLSCAVPWPARSAPAGLNNAKASLSGTAPLEAADAALRELFDGGFNAGKALESSAMAQEASAQSASYARLRELREVLGIGGGRGILPFTFRPSGGGEVTARNAGLEGFIYAEERLSASKGSASLSHHVQDYARYLEALLSSVSWAGSARQGIREIMSSGAPDLEKYDRLMAYTRSYTEALRSQVASLDKARWMREARVYEIFPRAFNLAGKRAASGSPPGPGGPFFADFGSQDLRQIKAQGFDTVWVMGIFPIGERNRSGTGGGSPYSIKDHEAIHPDLGTADDFRGFVRRAHGEGLKVVIDFVPNHTSMDSKLLMERPDYFINRRGGSQPRGTFDHTDPATGEKYWIAHGGYESFGSIDFWIDTAQVNYASPGLRAEMTRIVLGWVQRFGVDGFRVDMAYLDLNANFSRAWKLSTPNREFLEQLITSVKSAYPGTGFMAEAYDGWDSLSWCGFDLIYSKNNMGRAGGHEGWYDAVQSRDPGWIRAALKRAEFLQWQTGGSSGLDFIGNHDEASPRRSFGHWERGAAALTL
ncbi:MAG: alpha-amylase family glycosyl hydrolase, partial [Elusimicrobiota bacterium]